MTNSVAAQVEKLSPGPGDVLVIRLHPDATSGDIHAAAQEAGEVLRRVGLADRVAVVILPDGNGLELLDEEAMALNGWLRVPRPAAEDFTRMAAAFKDAGRTDEPTWKGVATANMIEAGTGALDERLCRIVQAKTYGELESACRSASLVRGNDYDLPTEAEAREDPDAVRSLFGLPPLKVETSRVESHATPTGQTFTLGAPVGLTDYEALARHDEVKRMADKFVEMFTGPGPTVAVKPQPRQVIDQTGEQQQAVCVGGPRAGFVVGRHDGTFPSRVVFPLTTVYVLRRHTGDGVTRFVYVPQEEAADEPTVVTG